MENTYRHQIDKIIIPSVFQDVLEFIVASTDEFLASYERVNEAAGLLYDISPALYLPVLGYDYETDLMPELNYEDTPFEIVPFSYNGSDALNYSWVNLAPELDLDDYPCVSFAPGENGALWLGDTTAQALSNLMVAQFRDWKKWGSGNENPPNEIEQWKKLVEIIGAEPDLKAGITPGARSDLRINPVVPDGWRFEMSPDGTGVLAEKRLFSSNPFSLSNDSKSDEYIKYAVNEIRESYPASALLILKYARSLYPENHELIHLFLQVYEMLGRDSHVKRVKMWLERNN